MLQAHKHTTVHACAFTSTRPCAKSTRKRGWLIDSGCAWGPRCGGLAADIDAIIKKGERDTADLNQKMQTFTENAMKFTMDGGINAYDFKVLPSPGVGVGEGGGEGRQGAGR